MSINGFHHVAIKSADFDRSYKFYTELLGLKEVNAWGEGDARAVMLAADDNSRIELFAGGREVVSPEYGIVHIAFRTEEPDKYIEKVRNAGYVITMEPEEVRVDTPKGFNARIAFCKGPSNEVI